MNLHILLTAIVIAATSISPAPLFPRGNTEEQAATSQTATSESETTQAPTEVGPDASEPMGAAEMERQMRNLLKEIGVRTFEEQISAVDFGIPSLSSQEVRLSDYVGDFVFLNFWATWCPPCREEMPSMEVMHQELSDHPFRVLAIDVQERPDAVEEFVAEMGYTFQILLDESGRVAANYGVRGIPTTYFISPRGTVLGMLVGTRYWDEPEVLSTMREIAEIAGAAER